METKGLHSFSFLINEEEFGIFRCISPDRKQHAAFFVWLLHEHLSSRDLGGTGHFHAL